MKTPSPLRTRTRSATRRRRVAVLLWLVGLCAGLLLAVSLSQAQTPVPGLLDAADRHRWMDELFTRKPGALRISLARFIFPGSHDSATYALSEDASCDGCQSTENFRDPVAACMEAVPFLAEYCETARVLMQGYARDFARAQSLSVGAQLDAGARFLDLRFFKANGNDAVRTQGRLREGQFYAHHGLAGPDSEQILDEIARFVNHPSNSREVVILAFSQMKEGDGNMDTATVDAFFDGLRQRIPGKMARKQTTACADDPDCTPTERFGGATTLGEFLDQGSQVIVTCSCTSAPDIWSPMAGATPYMVSTLDSNAAEGYPQVDSDEYPWRTDAELFRLYSDLSTLRDAHSQEEMFQLGFEIGLDLAGVNLYRWAVCRITEDIVTNLSLCGALNDDWDELKGLDAHAGWVNPKAIPATVGLRRDRVNVLTADFYTHEVTEEVFKLNLGATRVFHRIDQVQMFDDALDDLSDPDYYPAFFYPSGSPLTWATRVQRYNQWPDRRRITPRWPSWQAFPNALESAAFWLTILDADPGINGDDVAAIVEDDDARKRGILVEDIPIKACVESAGSCLSLNAPQYTDAGNVSDSTRLWFSRTSCVWSWVPGDIGIDPRSLCREETPEMRIYGSRQVEGDTGVSAMEFVVTLSVPSPFTITAQVSAAAGTAQAGTDFTLSTTSLQFQPGQTRQVVKVLVHGDTTPEPDETLSVTLGSPKSVTIATGYATGTIIDDDRPASLTAPGPQSNNEGNLATFDLGLLADERPAGPWTILVKWGDGTSDDYIVTSPGALSRPHRYNDNGVFTVSVTVVDAGHLETGPVSFPVTIGNLAPKAVIGNSGPVKEGGRAAVTMTTPTDPSTVDAAAGFRYAFSCVNGSLAGATYATSGAIASTWCDFPDNGAYTVRARIIDKDGGFNEYTTVVTVTNVVPLVTVVGSAISEHGIATVRGRLQDVGVRDTFTVVIAWGDGTSSQVTLLAGSTTFDSSHQYLDDNPTATPLDTFPVSVTVTDKDRDSASTTARVTVGNLAPKLGTLTLVDDTGAVVGTKARPVQVGMRVALQGAFTDVGTRDTHTAVVDWGDGAVEPVSVTEAGGAGTVRGSHAWLSAGTRTVKVTVADDDSGAATRKLTVVVAGTSTTTIVTR